MTLLVLAAVAASYQALALIAALFFLGRRESRTRSAPAVSILKPVRGLDPGFDAAIASHARIDYPEYEILFGVADWNDPAVASIRRLEAASGGRAIRLVESRRVAPNGKVAVLMDLDAAARHDVLVVNDSDITVPRNYLRAVVAPLDDPLVGAVTCLYRARASSAAGTWEALGVATDFAPGVLVAPWVGVREFGLGSTLVFRRERLRAIGGFEAIADYIADDYQLARRIRGLGLRIHLSRLVVETNLGAPGWRDVWRHQVRWARTIRLSRGGLLGYLGLPVTFATLWAALLASAGHGGVAGLLLALRIAVGLAGAIAVGDTRSAVLVWLAPLRDFWGVAVWIAGLAGRVVDWRDRRLHLDSAGRIVKTEMIYLKSSPPPCARSSVG